MSINKCKTVFLKLFVKKLSFLKGNRGIAPLFIIVLIAAAALAIPLTTKLIQQPQILRQQAAEPTTLCPGDVDPKYSASEYFLQCGSEKNNYYLHRHKNSIGTDFGLDTRVSGPYACDTGTTCSPATKDRCVVCKSTEDYCGSIQFATTCNTETSGKCFWYRGGRTDQDRCVSSTNKGEKCGPLQDQDPKFFSYCYSDQVCHNLVEKPNKSGIKYNGFCGSNDLQDNEPCEHDSECQSGTCRLDNTQGIRICASNTTPTPTPNAPAPNNTDTCSAELSTGKYECLPSCGSKTRYKSGNGDDLCPNNGQCCFTEKTPVSEGPTNVPAPTSSVAPTKAPPYGGGNQPPQPPGGPKATPTPAGQPCKGSDICGNAYGTNVPNYCTYKNNAENDTWCHNATNVAGVWCYSCSGGTPTILPTPSVTLDCPGSSASNNWATCGNAQFGGLGDCYNGNGSWSYKNEYSRDVWCKANAGSVKTYCYECHPNINPIPSPNAPTPITPVPTFAACPDVNSDGSRNQCTTNSCTKAKPDGDQACRTFYGNPSLNCCTVGNNMGSACMDPNKKCDPTKNNPANGANVACTGCGGFCVGTGSSGQCVNLY